MQILFNGKQSRNKNVRKSEKERKSNKSASKNKKIGVRDAMIQKKILLLRRQKERCQSDRMDRTRNPANGLCCSVGLNPTLSALKPQEDAPAGRILFLLFVPKRTSL